MPISRIKTDGIQDDAITSAKIGVDVIVADDLAANSVTVSELTDGAVTGAKLANNLNYDSGTLYLDSTNNRVGIGSSAPDGKLNVVSTAHNNGSIFDSTGTTQLWLRDTDATSNQRNWGFQVSGGDLNIVRANDDRASGFVTPVYIQQAPANSLVINSSGNVGIGTASPTGKLNIVNANGDGFEFLPSNTADTNWVQSYDRVNGSWVNQVSAALSHQFYTNGAERMRIDSSGEVLIGTDTQGRETNLAVVGTYQDPLGVWSQVAIYSSDSQAVDKGGTIGFGGQDGSLARQQFAALKGAKENNTSGNYAGYLSFYTRPNGITTQERMRIDSSGNVGINTTTMHAGLNIKQSADNAYQLKLEQHNTTDGYGLICDMTDGALAFSRYASSAYTERMRIESNGEVAINVTDAQAQLHVRSSDMASARDALRLQNAANNTGGYFIRFTNYQGSVAGYIEQTGQSSVNYTSSSDYRLKENIVDLNDATTRIKQLQPKRFNFITEPNTTLDGFLAHEVQSVVPEAVSGTKDAVDEQGNIKPQGIDQSKLVPLLVKTIQELEARITALESN